MKHAIFIFIMFAANANAQGIRYRATLPTRNFHPAQTNMNSQLANQNIYFSNGQFQGTFQYTQINTPQVRISSLYGFQNALGFIPNVITPSGYKDRKSTRLNSSH